MEDGNWGTGAGGYVGTWGDSGDDSHSNGNNGFSVLRSNTYSHSGDDGGSYFSGGHRNNSMSSLSGNLAKVENPSERWTRRCAIY